MAYFAYPPTLTHGSQTLMVRVRDFNHSAIINMTAKLIISLAIVLFVGTPLQAAPNPNANDLASQIISSNLPGYYNTLGINDEELAFAAEVNSLRRLQLLMLSDAVTEEVRISYALQILAKRYSPNVPAEKQTKLREKGKILGARLVEIDRDRRAEQDG